MGIDLPKPTSSRDVAWTCSVAFSRCKRCFFTYLVLHMKHTQLLHTFAVCLAWGGHWIPSCHTWLCQGRISRHGHSQSPCTYGRSNTMLHTPPMLCHFCGQASLTRSIVQEAFQTFVGLWYLIVWYNIEIEIMLSITWLGRGRGGRDNSPVKRSCFWAF